MDKKIIFFDIDGTIWDWNEKIPESTKEAFRLLISGGSIPVICSGRSRSHLLDPKLIELGFKDMVAACGGYVEADGKTIYEKNLPMDLVRKVVELSIECKIPIVLEGSEKHWVASKGFEQDDFVHRMLASMGDRIELFSKYSDDMIINKFSGDSLRCSDYRRFKETLIGDLDFIEHGLALNVDQNPNGEDNAILAVFECVPQGMNKGLGIYEYCRFRGIDPKDTIAIGDSINDIEMLKAAGYSVAMGNCVGGIDKMVDYVTADIHDDGIYKALKYLKLI